MCVYGSDYHFVKYLSCTMRNVEQNALICLLMGTWLDIIDILYGDDRFIIRADDHRSASFASLYAISSSLLALLIRKGTQSAGIGAPAITRCLSVVRLCVLRSLVDCFRLSV